MYISRWYYIDLKYLKIIAIIVNKQYAKKDYKERIIATIKS